MKTYYVMWTYSANYSTQPIAIDAESPEAAAERLYDLFSDDFRLNGKVYVMEQNPQRFENGVSTYPITAKDD